MIVATNAIDLLRGHDVYGYLNEYLRRGCMPNMTVMHGSFVPTVESMQVLLFYGAKWATVEARLCPRVRLLENKSVCGDSPSQSCLSRSSVAPVLPRKQTEAPGPAPAHASHLAEIASSHRVWQSARFGRSACGAT